MLSRTDKRGREERGCVSWPSRLGISVSRSVAQDQDDRRLREGRRGRVVVVLLLSAVGWHEEKAAEYRVGSSRGQETSARAGRCAWTSAVSRVRQAAFSLILFAESSHAWLEREEGGDSSDRRGGKAGRGRHSTPVSIREQIGAKMRGSAVQRGKIELGRAGRAPNRGQLRLY